MRVRRPDGRAGRVTGYPHPNQPYYNPIGRGMALQVAGISSIGGYGHENYRPFIIADADTGHGGDAHENGTEHRQDQ